MMLFYPAIFHEDENSVWVEFPDLEGCQTYGDTVSECVASASEALGLYAESLIERNIKLPPPSSAKAIVLEDEKSFIMAVYCDLNNYLKDSKAVKKTLTIPEWLNNMATRENINFSNVLQNALIEKLGLVSK